MFEKHSQLERYRQLLVEIEPLEKDWAAMLRLSLSENPVDRQLFDPIAFERVTEQMEKLDQELVEVEKALPDDPSEIEGETSANRRSA